MYKGDGMAKMYGILLLLLLLETTACSGMSASASVPSSFVTYDFFIPTNSNPAVGPIVTAPAIVGAKSSYNFYNNDFAVIRYTQDGFPDPVLDPTINSAATLPGIITTDFNNLNVENPANELIPTDNDDVANSVVVGPDRKITAAGYATIPGGLKKFGLARYNPDGSIDTTFNPGVDPTFNSIPGVIIGNIGSFNDIINGIIIDNAGNYVLVGTTETNMFTNGVVVRLTQDGQLDTSFNAEGDFSAGVQIFASEDNNTILRTITQDSQNRYLVVGSRGDDIFLARLNNDGTLDTTFNSTGELPGTLVTELPIRNSDGWVIIEDAAINKIIVGALVLTDAGAQEIAAVRYNENGTLDTSFNGTGTVFIPTPLFSQRSLSMQLEVEALSGNIVLNQYSKNIVESTNGIISPQLVYIMTRITRTGQLDTSFNPTGTSVIFTPAQVLAAAPDDNEQPTDILDEDEGFTKFFGFDQTRVTDTALNPSGTAGYEAFDVSALLSFTQNIVTTSIAQDITSGLLIDPRQNYIVAGFSNNGDFNNNFAFLRVNRNGTVNTFFNLNPPVDQFSIRSNPFLVNTFFDITFREFAGTSQPLPISTLVAQEVGEALFGSPELLHAVIVEPRRASIFTSPQVSFQGMAPPGSLVTLYLNNKPIATVKASIVGGWQYTTKLADEIYSFFVSTLPAGRATGQAAIVSESTYFAVATKLPDAPVITSPKENSTFTATALLFEGTARPDAEVYLYVNNQLTDTTQTDTNGKWQLYRYFPNAGTYTAYTRVIDALGRASSPSNSVIINKEYRPTQELAITQPGVSQLLNTARVIVAGTGPARSTITVLLNNKRFGSIESNIQGMWSIETPRLVDGTYNVSATVYDPITKTRQGSSAVPFTVRTSVGSPFIEKPALTLDVKRNVPTLISGRGEPDSIATLFLNRIRLGQTAISHQGIWSYVIPAGIIPQRGRYPIEVSVNDRAGNISSVSTMFLNFI